MTVHCCDIKLRSVLEASANLCFNWWGVRPRPTTNWHLYTSGGLKSLLANYIFHFQVFIADMKLTRSSREPGGQASNWRPPGTGSSRRPRPEMTEPCRHKTLNRDKKLNQKDSNFLHFFGRPFRPKAVGRIFGRMKYSELVFVILIVLSTTTSSMIAVAQPVEGNWIFCVCFLAELILSPVITNLCYKGKYDCKADLLFDC